MTRTAIFGNLSDDEARIEERIRTLCLVICAAGITYTGLSHLRKVLIPMVHAFGLKYLLQPLIDTLTMRPLRCFQSRQHSGHDTLTPPRRCPHSLRPVWHQICLLKLPYWLAVILALMIAFTVILSFGMLITDSVRSFTSRADTYSAQVIQVFESLWSWMAEYGLAFPGFEESTRTEKFKQLAGNIPVTQLVVIIGESLVEVLSNLFLILLFTVYLLIGGSERQSKSKVNREVDAQIFAYIKGKVLLSMLTGALTSLCFGVLQVDLWLVFGVMAFWLNFVPNVGAFIAVCLPLPIIIFDPEATSMRVMLSIMLPSLVHAVVGNVLEPVVFGHSMELQPVVVLLSLMLWGSLWGLTGMVLAVPITAVMRIHFSHIDHPLPRYLASVLIGHVPERKMTDEETERERDSLSSVELGPLLLEEGEIDR